MCKSNCRYKVVVMFQVSNPWLLNETLSVRKKTIVWSGVPFENEIVHIPLVPFIWCRVLYASGHLGHEPFIFLKCPGAPRGHSRWGHLRQGFTSLGLHAFGNENGHTVNCGAEYSPLYVTPSQGSKTLVTLANCFSRSIRPL